MTLTSRFVIPILILFVTPLFGQDGPKVSITPTPPNPYKYQKTVYPWKKFITATVFWVGEQPAPNNPTPNCKSSWDTRWQENFGGYDNPKQRNGLLPVGFTPKQNPFYIALPYNDCLNHAMHKPEASRVIPWFRRYMPKPGQSVCKGRWVQIVCNKKICYAQWEDCGPFTTDDHAYVFGNAKPKTTKNKGAGIDISPAVRDFFGVGNMVKVHWRFIEFSQVPRGPWSMHGTNNPFVNKDADPDFMARIRYHDHLRKLRDEAYRRKDISRSN
ncbi:hypothetical protein N9834_01405 [Akkermansiaceae bacterium]|nr:hypothetical protein [Akkermansiaceae bacterium]MDA7935937.1 hypothetical protein [bacterium]MDA7517933.1 hypothetical protein [Akkermansiaceae bacterium]MDA7519475.1 hypothetical protein [Akkermansiaceae bacterium]MDA7862918.1 hypothetical protein [Akkermansiaceae bacterium]